MTSTDNHRLCPKPPTKVFLRDATGLVREFGGLETLYLTVGSVLGFGWISLFPGMWGSFDGINIPLSLVFITILVAGNVGYYVLIGVLMPRSGSGSYIPLSRTIHPILGIGLGFAFVFGQIINAGYSASVVAIVGLSGPISVYGAVSHNAAFLSAGQAIGSPSMAFVIGTLFILIGTIVALLGNRIVKPFLWITFGLATLGYVTIIVVLLFTPQSQFQAAFDTYAGSGAYNNIISLAHNAGWGVSSSWMGATLLSLPFSYWLLTGYNSQTFFAGEVKRVSRNIAVGAYGSVIYILVIFCGLALLMQYAFGGAFISSISYLYESGSSSYTLSIPPYVTGLVAIATSNANPLVGALVALLVTAGMAGIGLLVMFVYIFLASRLILAFAFDRSIPAIFGSVNDRLHVPVIAIIFMAVFSEIAFVLYLLASPFIGAVNLTFVFIIIFLCDGLGGVGLFLRSRRHILDAGPPMCKKMIGGIPLITILGAYSVIFVGILLVLCLLNPVYGGSLGLVTAGSVVGAFVLGAISYVGMKKHLASTGIDLAMVFKELPPE